MNPLLPRIEALLFAAEEPLSTARLAELCGAERGAVEAALRELDAALGDEARGIQLEAVAGGWRLVTKPEHADAVARLRGPAGAPLSAAALETLAIVLYQQPVTRAEIDALRGVHSESALHTLIERGFVREVGRKDAPGRPALYGTTRRVLTYFGIRDIRDLPDPRALLPEGGPRQLYLRVPPKASGGTSGDTTGGPDAAAPPARPAEASSPARD
ncbi:MAG: SMC-Scp complex subunit ScpB [Firmicutes bacterium]|nr:SMC-Scp complex subunit ScpB [Bacillota bacterium]